MDSEFMVSGMYLQGFVRLKELKKIPMVYIKRYHLKGWTKSKVMNIR